MDGDPLTRERLRLGEGNIHDADQPLRVALDIPHAPDIQAGDVAAGAQRDVLPSAVGGRVVGWVMLPLERPVLIVMCTARPAFSAASDAATTAVADPGDGVSRPGEQRAGEQRAGCSRPGCRPVRTGWGRGQMGAGRGRVRPAAAGQQRQRQQQRVASVNARRDRFTFLC